jgi:PIN domain nuclease of toxin-antitoxin system
MRSRSRPTSTRRSRRRSSAISRVDEMKLLLDTHVWLWFVRGDATLPRAFDAAIRDPENTVALSIVSAWEVQIKSALGKLQVGSPIGDFLDDAVLHFDMLDVAMRHVRSLTTLPLVVLEATGGLEFAAAGSLARSRSGGVPSALETNGDASSGVVGVVFVVRFFFLARGFTGRPSGSSGRSSASSGRPSAPRARPSAPRARPSAWQGRPSASRGRPSPFRAARLPREAGRLGQPSRNAGNPVGAGLTCQRAARLCSPCASPPRASPRPRRSPARLWPGWQSRCRAWPAA